MFEEKIELDPIEVYKESLMQAVYKWEMHDLMLPVVVVLVPNFTI
jgi:hypothetical protein